MLGVGVRLPLVLMLHVQLNLPCRNTLKSLKLCFLRIELKRSKLGNFFIQIFLIIIFFILFFVI